MSDVEKQIAQWRDSLACSETMRDSDVDELENHLREELETLSTSGLSPNEAFFVARRRLGDTAALEAEFAKAHPHRRLGHHLFWMVVGVLTARLFGTVCMLVSNASIWLGYILGLRGIWLVLAYGVAQTVALAILVLLAWRYYASRVQATTVKRSLSISTGLFIACALAGLPWILRLVMLIPDWTIWYSAMVTIGRARHWVDTVWSTLTPFLLVATAIALSLRCTPTARSQG